jgi:hypothetical protein
MTDVAASSRLEVEKHDVACCRQASEVDDAVLGPSRPAQQGNDAVLGQSVVARDEVRVRSSPAPGRS